MNPPREKWVAIAGVAVLSLVAVAGIAIAGFLGFVESAVVLSGVVLWYSSVYVFALIFTGLFVYQSVVDACARPFMTAR